MGWRDLFVKNSTQATVTTKEVVIVAPFSGIVVSLDDVPDEVFSQRMIGDGVAIEPSSYSAISVVDAPYAIFTTNHAISYEGPFDLEIIVHIGLNTVTLKGKGFTQLQKELEGSVPVGTPLVEFDAEYIKKQDISLLSPIVVSTEKSKIKIAIIPNIGATINQGDPLLKVSWQAT